MFICRRYLLFSVELFQTATAHGDQLAFDLSRGQVCCCVLIPELLLANFALLVESRVSGVDWHVVPSFCGLVPATDNSHLVFLNPLEHVFALVEYQHLGVDIVFVEYLFVVVFVVEV